jgi:hypothetical protein
MTRKDNKVRRSKIDSILLDTAPCKTVGKPIESLNMLSRSKPTAHEKLYSPEDRLRKLRQAQKSRGAEGLSLIFIAAWPYKLILSRSQGNGDDSEYFSNHGRTQTEKGKLAASALSRKNSDADRDSHDHEEIFKRQKQLALVTSTAEFVPHTSRISPSQRTARDILRQSNSKAAGTSRIERMKDKAGKPPVTSKFFKHNQKTSECIDAQRRSEEMALPLQSFELDADQHQVLPHRTLVLSAHVLTIQADGGAVLCKIRSSSQPVVRARLYTSCITQSL